MYTVLVLLAESGDAPERCEPHGGRQRPRGGGPHPAVAVLRAQDRHLAAAHPPRHGPRRARGETAINATVQRRTRFNTPWEQDSVTVFSRVGIGTFSLIIGALKSDTARTYSHCSIFGGYLFI